jgi:hypothetical protein
MALVALNGGLFVPIGPGANQQMAAPNGTSSNPLDATNKATIYIGHIITSDGGSHTIDTTGSSSLGWNAGSITFANSGTTVVVGLGNVLTTAGPPARAVHVSDVITFDVSKSLIGGGGGISASAWQTHVPDTGSKTIANGDLVAFCIQMTARAGVDSIITRSVATPASLHRPLVTAFSGTYGSISGTPNAIITFADGALGYFHGCDIWSNIAVRTWNSGGATKEYGQLFSLPFPTRIYGVYGWVDPDNDFDIILYSDPLGTPVAEKTVSIDANTVSSATGSKFVATFNSSYATTVNQNIGVVFKPGAANISTYYRTIANAAYRITDAWGTSGYGISRASGAFADANSSLDHYYVGLIAGAFDAGGLAGRFVRVNDMSVVG